MYFSVLVILFLICLATAKRVYDNPTFVSAPTIDCKWMTDACEYKWVRDVWVRFGERILQDSKVKPRERYFTSAKLKKVAG